MLVPNWTVLNCARARPDARLRIEWAELAGRSMTPSGWNRPELTAAAMEAFGGEVATVRLDGRLLLALPVAERRLPIPVTGNWTSAVNFHGLPHADAELAVPALTAFLRKEARPVLLHSIPRHSALWEALQAAAGRFAAVESWERSCIAIEGTFEAWFEKNFERKRRKEYRRLRSRLAEQGRFEAASLAKGEDVVPWAEEFLRLEVMGWKGRRGTALFHVAGAPGALKAALAAMHAAGRLRFWKLALDGRAVAMLFAVTDGQEAWLGKIAHDPAFDRYSPGALVVLEATERMFAEGCCVRADSCAIPGHPMIDNIWRDRIAVADVLVAAPAVSPLAFHGALAAEKINRSLRGLAREFYHKITGRHRR